MPLELCSNCKSSRVLRTLSDTHVGVISSMLADSVCTCDVPISELCLKILYLDCSIYVYFNDVNIKRIVLFFFFLILT